MVIFYICPEFPYPANSGGKMVYKNHIDELIKNNKLYIVFFNNDIRKLNASQQNYIDELLKNKNVIDVEVVNRFYPKFSFKDFKSMLFFTHAIFSFLPRCIYVRKSKSELISSRLLEAEEIYVDHLASFGLLPKNIWFDKRISYYSHNVECEIIKDQIANSKSWILKFIHYLDFLKLKKIESLFFSKLAKIRFISQSDLFSASNLINKTQDKETFKTRASYIPFVLPMKKKNWLNTDNKLPGINALFVGGTDYFPNLDAAEWIVNILAKNYPNSFFHIVGDDRRLRVLLGYTNIPNNVIIYGRVSDEVLDELFITTQFFISPVVLGGGVKIKLIEAASYGIPILATRESTVGLEYNDKIVHFSRNNISLLNEFLG